METFDNAGIPGTEPEYNPNTARPYEPEGGVKPEPAPAEEPRQPKPWGQPRADIPAQNAYTAWKPPVQPEAQRPYTPPQPEPIPQTAWTRPQTPPQGPAPAAPGTAKRSPYADSPYVMGGQPRQEFFYQPQTQPPEKKKKEKGDRKPRSAGRVILSVFLVLLLVAGACGATAAGVNSYWEAQNAMTMEALQAQIGDLQAQIDANGAIPAAPGSSGPSIPVSGDGMTPSQIYASCVDSVVAISTTIQGYGGGSGSGFILTEDGYVVTNYHVVEGATSVEVVLHDGTSYAAQIVGYDASNDVAVLKVEAQGLPAAAVGSSSALAIGDMVVAIGNPLGELTATQTVGYVSGVGREVSTDSTIISMIQTDAAINPGNSGGPLFNMYGQVIGITAAKYSGTTNSGASIEGIGFAIPIDDVAGIIEDLMTKGYVTGAYLGVTVQNTDAEAAAAFGLPTGAHVIEVVPGGSADRAGVQPKDIIIDIGGYPVGTITELTRALRNFEPGDTTTITVVRSGRELVLDITLDEKPIQTDIPMAPEDYEMPSDGDYDEWYDYFYRFFGGGK